MALKAFSIIVPTYNGGQISRLFQSILGQSPVSGLEVVVVIDNSDKGVTKLVKEEAKALTERSIKLKLEQHPHNLGRFAARQTGAKAASHDQLLFLDDRTRLANDYFEQLAKVKSELAMGNVVETEQAKRNLIENALFHIRRLLYGKAWGIDFKSHYITAENFEKTPKGTASLWLPKKVFLDACESFLKNGPAAKTASDDTKLLRIIVDGGHKIWRSSKLKIYYDPRESFIDSWKHLYRRGAMFVDYYLKPGTRFFPLLVAVWLGFIIFIILLTVLSKLLLILLLVLLVLIGLGVLKVARDLPTFLALWLGIPLVALTFFLAILIASLKKLTQTRAGNETA